MQRIIDLDDQKFDLAKKSDLELTKNQSKNHNFKFMTTQADKDFARKVM